MPAARFLYATLSGTVALFCFSPIAPGQLRSDPAPHFSKDDPTPKPPSVEEQLFFRAGNAERAARGLPKYKWDENLARAARTHAALMAEAKELSHRLEGEPALVDRIAQAGARFSRVGENVAIGGDAPGIANGWMESPGHRANILDEHFTALGVGVVMNEGELYAVEDFSVAVDDLSIDQQEEKVAVLLEARGFRVSRDRVEARKSCVKSYVPDHHRSMAILRLEMPDLNAVSEDLERSLRSSGYLLAEVGACPTVKSEKGIARFSVVILLFPGEKTAAVR